MEKKYTLIWIDSENQTPKELQINYKKIKNYFILATCTLLFILSIFVFGVLQLLKSKEYAQLKKENILLKAEISDVTQKIGMFQTDLAKLIKTEKNLRLIAGLYDLPDDIRKVGHGGTSLSDYNHLKIIPQATKDNLIYISSQIDQMLRISKLENQSFREIEDKLSIIQDELNYTPSIKPTQGWYSSRFGKRKDPFTGRITFHKGLDISSPDGMPILAPADGKVIFVGKSSGYGKIIKIRHNNKYETRYGHLSRFNVKIGQKVKRYNIIGFVGNTGRSTAPHLHYEVRVKSDKIDRYRPVNPKKFIFN